MFRLVVHVDVKRNCRRFRPLSKAKMIRQLDKLRQNPTALREPDSKPLGQGLFEIRALGSVQGRGSTFFSKARRSFCYGFCQENAKPRHRKFARAEAIRGDAQ